MDFKKFIIENHPDPDSVFGIDKYDFEQMVILAENFAKKEVEQCNIDSVRFELPNDDIFDKPEVILNNPLSEFYYYERPAYLEDDQKQFRERLQEALNYLKGN